MGRYSGKLALPIREHTLKTKLHSREMHVSADDCLSPEQQHSPGQLRLLPPPPGSWAPKALGKGGWWSGE